ncbi:hypothetical protein SBBP1_30040 [Burkholderiales bacterium]|nr:hypothetical protein SBBP1_30040 [Burkholderiales bacterium]
MNRFVYRIHYQIDPRRIGHIAMNSDEVYAALSRFCAALRGYMAEINASAELPEALQRNQSAVRVVVNTRLDWAKASVAMAGFADRHGLRATHVTVALASVPAAARAARMSLGALLQSPQAKNPESCAA